MMISIYRPPQPDAEINNIRIVGLLPADRAKSERVILDSSSVNAKCGGWNHENNNIDVPPSVLRAVICMQKQNGLYSWYF